MLLQRAGGEERRGSFLAEAQLPGPLSHTPWGSWIVCLDLPIQSSRPLLHGPNTQSTLRSLWCLLGRVIQSHGHSQEVVLWTQG